MRLANHARNDEPFDDGEVAAAVAETLTEPLTADAWGAARAVEEIAENAPDRLDGHTSDLVRVVERYGDPEARGEDKETGVFEHAVRALRHADPSAALEVDEAVAPTVRQGDPMLAAAVVELFRAAVEAGETVPEAFVQEVFYRVGRSPNDYVMSVGGEFLEAVVLAGGETAPDAFEAFGVLLQEDQDDMTVVLGDRLVGLARDHEAAIPAAADVAMVGRALAERRGEVGVPDEEFTEAIEALERVSGAEFDTGGSVLDILPWR